MTGLRVIIDAPRSLGDANPCVEMQNMTRLRAIIDGSASMMARSLVIVCISTQGLASPRLFQLQFDNG
eukprot:gene18955-904_t